LSYFRSEASRQQVRSAFGRYLSPVVVERLAEHPERLELGGEMRNMTVMFADIRGFTTISERFKDDPQKLTQLINRFLTPMTEIVLKSGGTIDKYIGDCLMAFWNAPLDDEDHASHACQAAMEMLATVDPLNEELAGEFGLGGDHDGEDPAELYQTARQLALAKDGDLVKAAALLTQAAEHGYAPAQYNLGKAYRDGTGVKGGPLVRARRQAGPRQGATAHRNPLRRWRGCGPRRGAGDHMALPGGGSGPDHGSAEPQPGAGKRQPKQSGEGAAAPARLETAAGA
jgi:class 3 adenylate cyclase